MITINNVDVYGWEAAIRGMRNPMNSWDKSDTGWVSGFHTDKAPIDYDSEYGDFKVIGNNDHALMMKLAKAGSVHAKYRRMINVTCDINAPLYWWKEYDTYKVGTVANSCSTMHKIHDKEFTLDDFSHEHLLSGCKYSLRMLVDVLNDARAEFLNTNDKVYWWQMIQLLPSSYNQKRTVQLNYEVLSAMYRDRKNHKLDEWRTFCKWVESLPYSEIITLSQED